MIESIVSSLFVIVVAFQFEENFIECRQNMSRDAYLFRIMPGKIHKPKENVTPTNLHMDLVWLFHVCSPLSIHRSLSETLMPTNR